MTLSFLLLKGMIKMNKLLTKANIFLKRNSSTILTVAGATGVIATTVMAVKATPKAMLLLEKAEEEKGESLTKLEVVQTAGAVYVPAVLVGVSTIACIFGANILNKRRQASLMSAYALLDSSYKEYKNKLIELYGEETDTHVRHEIVKDKYDDLEFSIPDGERLFFDYNSLQYFHSTMEEVLKAQYRFSRNYAISGYATLNELCDTFGIGRVDWGDEVGWSREASDIFYNYDWVDFINEESVMDDGLEVTIISTNPEPHAGFLGF